MDVTSLYTNTPHDKGIEVCLELKDSKTTIKHPSSNHESELKFLKQLLKLNNVMRNGKWNIQVSGTVIALK